LGGRTLLTGGSLTQQALGSGILLRGLLPPPLHSLRGIPGAMLTSLTQRGNLPALLHYCGLQAPTSGTAGSQIRARGIQLRPVVPRAEPDTAGGAEADQ
ncbi:hypothetical protein K4W68_00885, partial [Pseudomonas aeruginosa]|nr:hypothetical protein [Pseudomonas aeruginosa]MCD2967704.1 hypothetical protein [Pseudomonas aeruginosa]